MARQVRRRALTVLELLVIVAIFAILAMIIIGSIAGRHQQTPEDLFEITPITSSQ